MRRNAIAILSLLAALATPGTSTAQDRTDRLPDGEIATGFAAAPCRLLSYPT